jgi:uncharacterized membrane protein
MQMPQLMEPAGDPVNLRALSFFAAIFGVLSQILYVFVDGRARVWTTVFAVLAFFACAALHAASESTLALVSLLVVGVVLGFVAEFVGLRVGFPFGTYTYAAGTWLKIGGVPIIVPFAWAMMGWPAFVAGRMVGKPILGAPILAAWDLFLDPQMVRDGRWSWSKTSWPKLSGIPITNLFGWLLVAALMMWLLDQGVNHVIDYEGIPLTVLIWTWLSSFVGHVLFFGLRSSGIIGGIGMGLALSPVIMAFLGSTGRRGSSGGARDGGSRDGGSRDGGSRDGGSRDGGSRESRSSS